MPLMLNRRDWVDFYVELSAKLRVYKGDRRNLVIKMTRVVDIMKEKGLDFLELGNKKNGELENIDPFTIFALFNGATSDSDRGTVAEIIKDVFSIDAPCPSSYLGVPMVPHNYIFYDTNEDIENLWNFYEVALRYADAELTKKKTGIEGNMLQASRDDYHGLHEQEQVILNDVEIEIDFIKLMGCVESIRGDGSGMITTALFWIAPETYMCLNTENRSFIYNSGEIPREILESLPDIKDVWKIEALEYFEFMSIIRQYLESRDNEHGWSDFVGLCAMAYSYNHENPNL